MQKRRGGGSDGRFRKRGPRPPKLEAGQRLLDPDSEQIGVVLEFACQYAHPKAAPNYAYLVRWEDGQVNAVTEQALLGERGLKPVE